ncbi:collagen-like protein [Clostridium tertium]|uniref:collagen-like triple helix repeat-containing protein n=1 Tax=Clostridium tertium TaxID=1559 RepID=UPI00232B5E15|nr:collagen-like protein [Clostridium tertium]MDB1935136.1 collagen-like protein [Clostridium tertium]MDB1938409.1 collagen-like protein [Clostridium tertium]
MASYEKHTWTDDEVITKEKLNHIEEGISNIELTPGPKGDPGEKGEKGDPGQKGADAVIKKLNKIDALTVESATTQDIATVVNNLIADLKAKGYMNEA